eukprot:3523429-Lingulodinium_polyedra.AAC.1
MLLLSQKKSWTGKSTQLRQRLPTSCIFGTAICGTDTRDSSTTRRQTLSTRALPPKESWAVK